MKEPEWLRLDTILAMHEQLLFEHGGSAGLRDGNLLDAALARPRQLLSYGHPTIFDLAAAYACGIIKNHPFIDGNKRTGFMAAFIFLEINGVEFQAPESEVVLKTLAVAAGELDNGGFSAWLKANS